MRMYILGVNHQIQGTQILSMSTGGALERFEAEQKREFRRLLRDRLAERHAEFVAEEARHGEESIAQELSCAEGLRYANVEMPPMERTARGILPGYESNANIEQADKAAFHREREAYMFERTIAEARGAESVIVVCGRNRVSALAARFRGSDCAVEVGDLQDEDWYVEDWITHMMRL